ncbi:MAG: hypothetical protein ABIA74_02180 [bacterium]
MLIRAAFGIFIVQILLIFYSVSSQSNNLNKSIRVLKINSIKQRIENYNKIIFQGSVDILIDKNFHIWADFVEVDKEKQILIARSNPGSFIEIENNDFIILAESFSLELDNKNGIAKNVKIHFDEGFVSAQKAEKVDNNWYLDEILFTPCDKIPPHWSITAKHATLYGNYLLRTSGIIFKAGDLPIFIWPYLALPIQGKSRSGFLLPKFSYDDDLGPGINQEFYWYLSKHCDSTFRFDWRDRKGLVFSDLFRWARGAESFSEVNAQYAIERGSFFQRKDEVVKGTTKHYWITGKDFRPIPVSFSKKDISNLLRVDFGTDKRIGFEFFNETESVEDTFNNSLFWRHFSDYGVLKFTWFDGSKSWRKRFFEMSDNEIRNFLGPIAFEEIALIKRDVFSCKKELEDRIEVWRLPRFEFNSAYKNIFNFFSYRQDFFVDRISSRQMAKEQIFFESRVVKQKDILPLQKTDTLRFFYQGELQKTTRVKDQLFKFFVEPQIQLRSKVMDENGDFSSVNCLQGKIGNDGAYRFFANYGIEWALPEYFSSSKNFEYSRYIQPLFRWDFVPKIFQDNWYHVDEFDEIFPKNRIEFCFRNNWYWQNLEMDIDVSQGFDFYNRDDFFYLDRVPHQKNLLPFKIDFGLNSDGLNIFLSQEYDLGSFKLLQSQINAQLNVSKFNLFVGLYYQNRELQKTRKLLSDLPHFVFFGIDIPITKQTSFTYTGHFYSTKQNTFLPLEGIEPLVHKIYLNYSGHCWGMNLGFEEKNYRQFGNWKSEKAFVLSIKLESLGSFSRKFKRPVMSHYDW